MGEEVWWQIEDSEYYVREKKKVGYLRRKKKNNNNKGKGKNKSF